MSPTSTITNTTPAMANTGMIRFWMFWDFSPRGLSVVRGRPSARPMLRISNQPTNSTRTPPTAVQMRDLRLSTSYLSVAGGGAAGSGGVGLDGLGGSGRCGELDHRGERSLLAVLLDLTLSDDASSYTTSDDHQPTDQQGPYEQ